MLRLADPLPVKLHVHKILDRLFTVLDLIQFIFPAVFPLRAIIKTFRLIVCDRSCFLSTSCHKLYQRIFDLLILHEIFQLRHRHCKNV